MTGCPTGTVAVGTKISFPVTVKSYLAKNAVLGGTGIPFPSGAVILSDNYYVGGSGPSVTVYLTIGYGTQSSYATIPYTVTVAGQQTFAAEYQGDTNYAYSTTGSACTITAQ
jgi:hypothetical protein